MSEMNNLHIKYEEIRNQLNHPLTMAEFDLLPSVLRRGSVIFKKDDELKVHSNRVIK